MSYSATILGESTLNSYWELDDTSGTTAVESVFARNGTYNGGPTLGVPSLLPAPEGTAVTFDGVNDTIYVPHNVDWNADAATGVAIEFGALRLNNPTWNALQILVDKTSASSNNGQWGVWWENRSTQGSPLALRFLTPSNPIEWAGVAARDALAAGGHLVCRWDATTKQTTIWWNGQIVASSATGITPTWNRDSSSFPLRVASLNGTGSWAALTIEKFALYIVRNLGNPLTDARIAAHHDAANGTFPPAPSGSEWWDGSTRQAAALKGWWDGAAIQPATAQGWWDGAAVQPIV